ncbi:unnamed protein product [Linum trigynum]|uniref:Uncharacterized protein n=1 Tax=Linum trigynum TaxID=586398 RepID=A0AAV2E4E7_9ROSI
MAGEPQGTPQDTQERAGVDTTPLKSTTSQRLYDTTNEPDAITRFRETQNLDAVLIEEEDLSPKEMRLRMEQQNKVITNIHAQMGQMMDLMTA